MNNIEVKIKTEQDLYESFNQKKELNDAVTGYIKGQFEDAIFSEPICFHIISEEPVDEETVKQAFLRWNDSLQNSLNRQKQINLTKQLWMFGVGVCFIVMSLILEATVNLVIYTILSTIGAFAMWEAAAIWIVENPKNRLHQRMIRKIAQESTFQFTVERE